MLEFVAKPRRRPLRIVCLGSHCDDIEIGCGASLLSLQQRSNVIINWVVMSGSAQRRLETSKAMRALVRPAARGGLIYGDFRDGNFPDDYSEMKAFIERVKASLKHIDIVLTHEREDRHQDHRLVNELTWNTFRDHVILEYEIPKWDGGLGQPNIYIPVSAAHAREKISALLSAYKSQRRRDWFTRETFMSLLRLRGIECRSPSGYAEAFHGRKILMLGK